MSQTPVVAIVGATGAVGQTMIDVLEERDFPLKSIKLLASQRSAGKQIGFRGEPITIEKLDEYSFDGVDIALFSAGASISETYAPIAVKSGALVIDNTSHFRYIDDIPLVVPEANRADIFTNKGIIANPNCSTAQLILALKPIHEAAQVTRMIVSTYQSTSGAGASAREEMFEQSRRALDNLPIEPKKFVYPIAFNVIPHIDRFLENGYTKEEMKMVWETHKIMHDDSIAVCCTCVRVPVANSHSESINLETKRKITAAEAREILADAPGVVVVDDPANNRYPMPILAQNTDPVYVGRIREDTSHPNGLNLWVVADNLRKGAALNAVQIAEEWIKGE